MDADGASFDTALLSAVAAFSHCKFAIAWIFLSIPVVITCPMRDNNIVLYIPFLVSRLEMGCILEKKVVLLMAENILYYQQAMKYASFTK